jgi:hypothetical protein
MSLLEANIRSARESVSEACSRIAMSWNNERAESAMNLMDAFELLHCARVELESAEKESKLVFAVLEKHEGDDEPSIGDQREAEDVVGLARCMQQKRHGASP